jgi:uncharacterized membrane protein YkoI
MTRKHWIILGATVALLAVAAGGLVAGRLLSERGDVGRHGDPSLQGEKVMELAAILDVAVRRVPGDVVKVELERDDGRLTYEVKVLAENGRVREIKLDARDGSLIEIEDD